MARLNRNKPNLTVIKGGKKDKQYYINIALLIAITISYILVLKGH